MKAKKTTINKNGRIITLVNPEKDIDLDILILKFGDLTLKVNHIGGPLFDIEGRGGLQNIISQADNISSLDWEEINL